MKRYLAICLTALFFVASSCDKDFEEINTDPNKADASVFDPNLILPKITYNYGTMGLGYSGGILFQSMWMQIFASTSTGGANYYSNADKYVASGSTTSYIQNVWTNGYSAASRAHQMQKLAEQKGLSNLARIAEISKIITLAFVSDVYGDVPYSEALKADEGITQPVYDSQKQFYSVILADLEKAIAAIDPSKDIPTNDVLYKGNLVKWKKFGYSMMLKLAMRLVKVDPAMSKSYVEKALSGGIFESIDDEAVLPTEEPNFNNTNANALNVIDDIYEVRWSKTMIDYLKKHKDPRLSVVAEVPNDGLKANNDGKAKGNSSPEVQLGLPNGYDLKGGNTDISKDPNFSGPTGSTSDATPLGKYSRPTAMYRNRNAPIFLLTYAETQLLLADAAARGYHVGYTAIVYYAKGVEAAMLSMQKLSGSEIPAKEIAGYLAANPLSTDNSSALKTINEQIWATTGMFSNYVEAWNNWKRSGYPELKPINYSGNFSSGEIPRRQLYPASESTTNPANIEKAINNMGSDKWTTRIWWDVKN